MPIDGQCSDERLRSLLRSDDGDESPLAASHIAECSRCQARLEELAAQPNEWQNARESLITADGINSPLEEFAENARARNRWQSKPTAWTESMARQLLSPPSHPEMLGRIGRYEVERLIGAGGMGVVFKAFDTELNRPVAVKVLAPFLAGSGAARKRFAREARAAAAVVHEHVVSIHNVETDGESPFLVMHYVPGESLQGRIDREGPLDVCEILRIGMQTAAGLAAAHAQGLVHRDVKPSNILLEKGVERALLTDFGLARASDDASLTHTGYHPGTPQYMSPEQARGDSVDTRSDLFSLGSVIYTMCTGRPPFRAETSYGILRRITDTEPRSIREINPNIPDWLESIVAKLMAKQPDDRFASADEVAELLEDCLAHVQQPTTIPLPESCRSLVERHNEDQQTAAGPRFPRKPPSSALRLVVGAAAALSLLFAGILIVLELNKGTLTIESEADDVPIRIMQGEEVVEQMTVTKSGKSVRVTAGKYRIEIAGEFPELSVVDGVVSMKRGETETVTIAISHSTTVGQKREPMNSEQPTPSSRLLVDVVLHFNEVHQKADDVGHKQPLLTDDEVIAAVRSMSHQIGDLDISESEYRILRNAIERGYFPNDWTIDSSNYFQLRDGRAGERWRVQLTLRRDGSARRTFTFRSRYVRIEPELPASTQPLPAGNVSLADWVAKVNEPEPAIYLSLPESPVTEQEIVAALTDLVDKDQSAEFAPQRKALREIIKTRSLPEKAELTLFRPQRHPGIVSRWANREGYENRDWTLRLRYPCGQGEKEIVTAAIIGFRLIDSRPVDHVADDEIHWGAPAADGLQFGVAVEEGVLDQESYPALTGSAYYQPHFYLRNPGKREMTFVQLPRIYEHYEMDARTATGEQLPMKRRQGSYGTSILNLPDQLNGESRIHKNAYSFVVGNYATRFFEDSLSLEPPDPKSYENYPAYAINAPLNTPLRVRISIPHPTLRDSTQLMSGEIRLPALAVAETDLSVAAAARPNSKEDRLSPGKELVPGIVDFPAGTMPVEIVLPHQFRLHWPGAMERSPTTARFAIPVSEPSQIRLNEIIGHHGLEIGVTIEPTDFASSEKFAQNREAIRIKFTQDDLPALKATQSRMFPYEFTYDEENGTAIANIKITAQQRPVTPIADIKELGGTWRLVDVHLVSDQPLGPSFYDLEGYKSTRIAIGGPEWRYVREGNELFRTLEASYDLAASPQKVYLKFTSRESEKHERRLIELHGDELITARHVVGRADVFPASFDEPMILIEQYQRVGVVTDRIDVDEHTVSISIGTADGLRLNQQLQITDGSSVLGTVETYEIGKHESYARVVEWSADRPIRKGDCLIPIGATDASQALDAGFPSDAVLQEMHDLLSEETRLKLDLRYVQQFLEGGKLFAKTDASQKLENSRRKESIEARQQEITNRLKVIHESELGDLHRVAENASLECAEEPLYGQSSYGVIVYAKTLDRIQKDELLLFHAGSLYRTRGTIRPLRTTGIGFFLRPNVAIPSGRHIAMSCIQDAEEERENVKNGFMPDSNRARNPSRAYRANVYDRQSGKLIQAEQPAANGPRAELAEIEEAWTQRSKDVSTSRLRWTENRIYPRGEKLSPNEPEPLAADLTIAWEKKLIIVGDKCRIEGIGKTWDFRVRRMAPFEFTAVRNETGSSYHNYPDQTDNLGYFSESLKGLADVTYRPALLGTNPGDPDCGRIDLADYHVVPRLTEINGRKCIKLESNDNLSIDNQLFLDPERQFVVTRSISSTGAQVMRQLDLSYKQDSRGIWYPASWQFQMLNGNLDRHAIHIAVVTTEFESDFVASPEDFEIQYRPGTLIYDQRTQGTTVKLRVQEDGSHQATSNIDSREDRRELQDPNVISQSPKPPSTDWESTNQDLESYRIDLVPFESRSQLFWDDAPMLTKE